MRDIPRQLRKSSLSEFANLNLRVEFATYDSLIHHQFMKYETERWMGRGFLALTLCLTLSLSLSAAAYGQMLVPSDVIVIHDSSLARTTSENSPATAAPAGALLAGPELTPEVEDGPEPDRGAT